MRAYSFVLMGTALSAIASCTPPAHPSVSAPQSTGANVREPCTEVVASTKGLSAGHWDEGFAAKRIIELLGEHSIPYELGSGEWHVLVPPLLATKARMLLGAAIDVENLAARIEPADPAVQRPYELPPAAIARWPSTEQAALDRFEKELWDRFKKEGIPRFVIGTGVGERTIYVRADKAEVARKIAAEMIAAESVPAVVVLR